MGVEIEFVAAKKLAGMDSDAKIKFILEAVKKFRNKIIVLESGLSRGEEKQLIEKTMSFVTRDFPGIEIASLGGADDGFTSQIIKLLGGKTAGLTVVGPSNLVRQVKRDPNKLSLLAGK